MQARAVVSEGLPTRKALTRSDSLPGRKQHRLSVRVATRLGRRAGAGPGPEKILSFFSPQLVHPQFP